MYPIRVGISKKIYMKITHLYYHHNQKQELLNKLFNIMIKLSTFFVSLLEMENFWKYKFNNTK